MAGEVKGFTQARPKEIVVDWIYLKEAVDMTAKQTLPRGGVGWGGVVWEHMEFSFFGYLCWVATSLLVS